MMVDKINFWMLAGGNVGQGSENMLILYLLIRRVVMGAQALLFLFLLR